MGECATQFVLSRQSKGIFDYPDESYELGSQYISTYAMLFNEESSEPVAVQMSDNTQTKQNFLDLALSVVNFLNWSFLGLFPYFCQNY